MSLKAAFDKAERKFCGKYVESYRRKRNKKRPNRKNEGDLRKHKENVVNVKAHDLLSQQT